MATVSTSGLRVRDVMTRDVVTVNPNDKLLEPDRLMKLEQVRHMPVIDDDGALVGILSQRDFFDSALIRGLGYGTHGQEKLLDTFLVKDAMKTDIVTIAPDGTLAEAAARLLDKKIGCLPVVDGEELVGIITESDFVELYVKGS